MRKAISVLLSLTMVLSLCACGGGDGSSASSGESKSEAPKQPPDLTGQWKQSNSGSEDSYQGAIIGDNAIEIYWVSDGGETTALYWAGSFVAPETADEPYVWESENDKDKTDYALLASGDDTKEFTYKNGKISYSASALGTTKTIELEKEEWSAGMEINTSSSDFDEDSVISQLEVKQLSYSNDFWNYAFLTIRNNSEYNLSISANVNFYDENGNLVGAKDASQEAVESGYSTVLMFMPDEKFEKMEYELNVKEEDWYECVQSDLSYEATEAKDKVILSVTNNGEEAAEFVQANVLFYNGDELVGFSDNYITDDDSELKPGKTINKEMDCFKDFDSYQVYFSGRR